MKTTLPILLLLGCLTAAVLAQSPAPTRTITFVSVGDSVASGEGNPDIPAVVRPNLDYNPVQHLPNPKYDPRKKTPNSDYHPFETLPNANYDPFEWVINPHYQPFPVPAALLNVLPGFPPYDLNLTIKNPTYDPRMVVPNPDFDPNPLVENPNYDPNLWSVELNVNYLTNLYLVEEAATWAEKKDHRSNLAGPALAAAELKARYPNADLAFVHLAKSGAKTDDPAEPDYSVINQIQKAKTHPIVKDAGRIDILTISVGGNDVHPDGFGGLITACGESIRTGVLPSEDAELNADVQEGLAELPDKLDRLADAIGSAHVGQVFITEYFDPTRDSEGFFCLGETEWAYDQIVVPLNAALKSAALRHGWHYVGGIAERFRTHGHCAAHLPDPRKVILNPHYDPLERLPNPDYNPIQRLPNPKYNPIKDVPNFKYNPVKDKPNLNYNPFETIPNPNYNPIEQIPNPNYNPLENIPNPAYQPFPWRPKYDKRLTIPNPDYDPNLLIPNPAYDGRLTLPNPKYSPELTVPNPAYNPALTLPNPDYDPELTLPNPDYDPDLTIPNPDFEFGPVVGDNWVVRFEESIVIQGDWDGTAHPNAQGHAIYRDRLVEEINRFVDFWPAPRIAQITASESTVRLLIENQYPVERIEIQRTPVVSDPEWVAVDCNPIVLENGLCEATVTRTGASIEFFRLLVK